MSNKEHVSEADPKWLSDPRVFRVNRIDAHSSHYFYEEKVTEYGADMPLKQMLNGVWKMAYAKNPGERIVDFYKEDFDCSDFLDFVVPGHIEMAGYDKCQYINTMYPWEGHEDLRPPHIPVKDNPVSSFVTYFDLNDELKGKRNFLSFQGVETAFYVWLNGHFVGYSEDSFTPAEFEITDYVKESGNKLAVEVYKRSSASWLEDQDFFRFSGIFRDVYVYAIPKLHVADVFAKAGLDETYTDGILNAELKFTSGILGADDAAEALSGTVGFEIMDKSGKVVATKMGIAIKETVNLSASVKNVLKWSAEVPDLYMFNISVYDSDGELVEYVPVRIGFRTFEMKNGLMLINGKRIIFKGVNRHEFSATNGRAIKKEEMERDIKIIKQLNINAVRTCHYPNHPYWYELCDELGIYLIDEANLETHGTWNIDFGEEEEFIVPGSKPEWKDAVVDRATSMLERDKNHPSVIIWSCGNESHAGEDILAMSDYFHKRNPERVVHYEGCTHNREYAHITDMESHMYSKPKDIEEYLKSNPDKPFINCEYTHAMGNSCGNMFMYTDLEDKYEQYQGGFIWDFVDQAILKKNDDGKTELLVGGDSMERPCDYYFCGNGIVFADRKVSPKAQEVKFLYRNIKLYPTNEGVLIVNDNLFESTYDYIFEVRMLRDGKAIWAGSFSRDIPAGEKEFVPVSYPPMDEPGEYITECRAMLMGYRPWSNPGHLSSWGQSEPVTVSVPTTVSAPATRDTNESTDAEGNIDTFVDVIMGSTCIGVTTKHTHAIFSRQEGSLISFVCKGVEMIERMPKLTLWRAATDNDKGNRFPQRSAMWMGASQFPSYEGVKVEYLMDDGRVVDGTVRNAEFILPKSDEKYGTGEMSAEYAKRIKAVIIEFSYKLYTAPSTDASIKYTMTPDGKCRVDAHFSGKKGLPELPVFGVTFAMDKKFGRMEYYGRGPEENYNDRCKGARLGIFKSAVRDNMTPYLDPQECGNRHDVRYVKVVDEFNHGLLISHVDKPFDMTVLPYTQMEIQETYKINRAPKSYNTVVSILGACRGVGGDDSWGAPVYPEFSVSAEEDHDISFTIEGI